jgi:hypothetical protein
VDHVTNDSYSNEEIKKNVSWSKGEMSNSIKIMHVSTNTKVQLLQTSVFLAVLCGCKGKQLKE